MTTGLAQRPEAAQAVRDLLDAVERGSLSGVVLEGEPGIGKTTVWSDAIRQAGARGHQVLSARSAAAESRLAYASLADLLAHVEDDVWAKIPTPQRLAVERVLLRTEVAGAATDPRAIGAALVSVVEYLARAGPIIVGIDDLQWVDPSSARVLAFAARRWPAGVGVLATARSQPDQPDAAAWLDLARPGALLRVPLRVLSLGALHAVLSERLGRSFSRPTMVRIQQVSGGNPLYALELARAIAEGAADARSPLPATLSELVEARLRGAGAEVREVLLAAASVAEPTVELVGRAVGLATDHTRELLERAESGGVLTIEGHRVRFSHPLWAAGAYAGADHARRRALHRRLGEIVEEPEQRARHLALGAVQGDPVTVQALDDAAGLARARGAPAAAAELLALAVDLGAQSPDRRFQLAHHHFEAGDIEPARQLLQELVAESPAGPRRAVALSLLAVVHLHDDSFQQALNLLEQALAESGANLELGLRFLIQLSYARLNAGEVAQAWRRVQEAVRTAERLGHPALLSQALGMAVMLAFLRGDGLREAQLARAVELEDPHAPIPVAFRPTVQHALLLAWTGRLDEAHERLLRIQRRCLEHGEENELIFVGFHLVQIQVWRGEYTEAASTTEATVERAEQLGGDVPRAVALTLRAVVAAHAGREKEARQDTEQALETYRRCGWQTLGEVPLGTLGFLELSLGNHEAALGALEPLLAKIRETPEVAEIVTAPFVPDAAEALIYLGRLEEAEELVNGFDHAGHRLGRTWTIAVSARCRSMLLAARGNLDAAVDAARYAMAQHDRLAMPFERARTQLLIGQLQRRTRRREAATATLTEALNQFETLRTPLWADRVRVELARIGGSGGAGADGAGLTPSELRVAQLAAGGMTNREVAVALFISPKTVEANLARIYRKLNIRSRAELGQHMGRRSE
jgi:DNA-binding CsgD family transcriptional regulator